jgi:hypothetical protein
VLRLEIKPVARKEKAVPHRKAALFYKTDNGAHVGDMFMSLIRACELCNADPFDYRTQLQLHVEQLAANPQNWLPRNYRDSLQPITVKR